MTNKKLVLPDSPHLCADKAGRLCSPSATRNLAPIRERFDPLVPKNGKVLELASGTGQQITALAEAHPDTKWQPSDLDPTRLQSIRAWRRMYQGANLMEPLMLDVAGDWQVGIESYDLVFAVNLFHLITHADAERAIASAARVLKTGGHLFIYGPFTDAGRYRSPADASFDRNLKQQNADIGYKDDNWVVQQMMACGLKFVTAHQMPANNLALVARSC